MISLCTSTMETVTCCCCSPRAARSNANVRGTRPGLRALPYIVCVLPLPVGPYASTAAFAPAMASRTRVESSLKTSLVLASSPKAESTENRLSTSPPSRASKVVPSTTRTVCVPETSPATRGRQRQITLALWPSLRAGDAGAAPRPRRAQLSGSGFRVQDRDPPALESRLGEVWRKCFPPPVSALSVTTEHPHAEALRRTG
mmetsp:Transcript_1286/g.3134  ORF Transcript_1286/g.3134 Transcript_1286/m.3134 type:complete len:201 (+) Transcript_1286:889-1491(+)